MNTQFPDKSKHYTGENYTGPRDTQYLKAFICHGCQTCWQMDEAGNVIDTGPHILSIELVEAIKQDNNHG